MPNTPMIRDSLDRIKRHIIASAITQLAGQMAGDGKPPTTRIIEDATEIYIETLNVMEEKGL